MTKENKYLTALICVISVIALVAVRYSYNENNSPKVIVMELIPEFIGCLIVFPFIFFFYEVWGFKINDKEEDNIVNKITGGITEVINANKGYLVFRNQSEANQVFKDKISLQALKAQQVQIIQYSSDYVLDIIRYLVEARIRVDLMICDPNKAHDELQKKKIEGRLAEYTVNKLYKEAIATKQLCIYLYDKHSTIRAIKTENLLMIGSYLFTDEVHGDDNFVVMFTDKSDERAISAVRTFDTQFDFLKKSATLWKP